MTEAGVENGLCAVFNVLPTSAPAAKYVPVVEPGKMS
jgi:hypothetical protein